MVTAGGMDVIVVNCVMVWVWVDASWVVIIVVGTSWISVVGMAVVYVISRVEAPCVLIIVVGTS